MDNKYSFIVHFDDRNPAGNLVMSLKRCGAAHVGSENCVASNPFDHWIIFPIKITIEVNNGD